MDTDNFLFKNIDVFKEMQNGALMEHMDLSSFPTNYLLYSEENRGKLGLLKPEVICLALKCYNVLLEDGTLKNTAKGVILSENSKFRHDTY